MDLNLCISNGTVSTNFPFLDGDVPRRTSYGVYISQLIRFARASSNLNDFNYRNKGLTDKLLSQTQCLVRKISVSLKTLLQQGISEPEFYGDLVYRFRSLFYVYFVIENMICMKQLSLLDVILNMLFILTLILKLTTLDTSSKFHSLKTY